MVKVLQEQPVKNRNFFLGDDTLALILRQNLPTSFHRYAEEALKNFGERVATDIDVRAAYTDREGRPKLVVYDKFGEEISEVWTNEGYQATVKETYDTGIVGYLHKNIPELGHRGNYMYSFAQGYLLSQAEPGFYCPVTLSMATGFLLEHYASEELKQRFLVPVSSTGEGVHFEGATFLTERQGGSDVGANVVEAIFDQGNYRLYGEKYFASNAGMAGVAMVLARMKGAEKGSRGLTLFAVPWRKKDGTLNNLRIRKLKDKLGVIAVPSGEVEFNGAEAFVVGDASKGFYYMMEALNLSRVCNAIASLGIMRRAFVEAREYASLRHAFGKKLTDFPMVKDSLGKMAAVLHVEVATTFDFIKQYDKIIDGATPQELLLNRLNIAILKKETADQAIHFAHEAIEMHGGNGYMEEFVTSRLLRDAQVLPVWEGTANILGLEIVRLVKKHAAHELFITFLSRRLDQLQTDSLQTIVVDQLAILEEQLHLYASLSEEMLTFEAKAMAKKMALLYEAVVAVEWAQQYGGRYEKLAQVYIEERFNLRKLGDDMTTVRYFDDLIQ
ncbi:acyl-CoA dehydrogenase family protein [Kurthia sibirica]|uniref:Isovaleryl-CoA dehydrogenase n=1 Tax=Kurthia sibirica TaxID=202750 RepID=A0A2U3APR3_9BACL|nr:acyl-CoA dehydrogenase family protein [Kurthia sibirica]PWI26533.1 isovaleryl-CoA dehydrogenase [Kurthia sibirica]GEK32778.1 acyl-CoA dehydrogenase [Kurthia sibirica]